MNTTPAGSNDAPTALSWGFAEDHAPLPDAVREARDESIVAGVAPVSPGVAATLRVLAATTQARAVVEIGTDLGASALSFLSGMARDGILTSIDPEPQNQNAARRLITQAGYPSSRFRLIAGNALDVLPKLRDGAYDIVFVNGNELEYVEYVAGSLRLLRHGGLLVVHDVLWHNEVADAGVESDEAIIIREALEAVTESESYTQTLLPVGNGLLVAVKE